jgi:hypothetical protein
MEALFIITFIVLLLNVAARRWGADSRDGYNSAEWDQRRGWLAFH